MLLFERGGDGAVGLGRRVEPQRERCAIERHGIDQRAGRARPALVAGCDNCDAQAARARDRAKPRGRVRERLPAVLVARAVLGVRLVSGRDSRPHMATEEARRCASARSCTVRWFRRRSRRRAA